MRASHIMLAVLGLRICSCSGGETTLEPSTIPVECGASMSMTLEVQPSLAQVDILLVVDDSKSMTEEQAALSASFPILIRSLLDPPANPLTGVPDRPPLSDLHVGVVSTDMGTGGYTVETCSDPVDGDDGILLHAPYPTVEGCEPSYPPYLGYKSSEPNEEAIDWLATGFGCIATLGTSGCGWEQQLEAARRAIEHSQPGRANEGFLRDGSILVIVWLTDEEDCSPSDNHIYDTADSTLGHLSLRCYLHPYMLTPVEEIEYDLRLARPDPGSLVLAFLVGVPPDAACETTGDEIAGCLDLPIMNEQIDPADPTRLRFSCNTPLGYAFPPRRMVQLARSFGSDALVRSICTDDLSPAVTDLSKMIEKRIGGVTLSTILPQQRATDDPCLCRASCDLVETLSGEGPCPLGHPCLEPDGPGSGCAFTRDEEGTRHALCVVPQVDMVLSDCSESCDDPGASRAPATGDGWIYVNGTSGPRVVLTSGGLIEAGATTHLACCFY